MKPICRKTCKSRMKQELTREGVKSLPHSLNWRETRRWCPVRNRESWRCWNLCSWNSWKYMIKECHYISKRRKDTSISCHATLTWWLNSQSQWSTINHHKNWKRYVIQTFNLSKTWEVDLSWVFWAIQVYLSKFLFSQTW